MIWGFLPALIWVTLGAIFIGCVHDFGAIFVSIRHKGKSIGAVLESIIGKRAKGFMHGIIFFLVALGMGVFVYVIAFLFSPAESKTSEEFHFPQAIIPSFGLMFIAMVMALKHKYFKVNFFMLSIFGFLLTLLLIWFSIDHFSLSPSLLNDAQKAPGIYGL